MFSSKQDQPVKIYLTHYREYIMVNLAFPDIRKMNNIMSLIDKYAIHFDFYILGPLDCDLILL